MTKAAIFITGAWMHTSSWDKFRSAFEAAGYSTSAPAWPYLDGNPLALRTHPDKRLGSLTLQQIVAHYQTIIGDLPERPLIVGHSFGGLITQLLLDRGAGVAGVALDPAPIAGVIPGPVSLMAALGPILAGPSTPFTISRAAFGTTFANTVPALEQTKIYDDYVVPTSSRIFYQAAFMLGTKVDAGNRKQPLLITVGEKDRTVTPYVAKAAYNLQKRSSARTDFKQFPGRSHFLAGEAGWEEVATYAIDWARQVGA
jgi:pimeloyl-ACP methyl ester carboxylesterase